MSFEITFKFKLHLGKVLYRPIFRNYIKLEDEKN